MPARIVFFDIQRAGSELEDPLHDLQCAAQLPGAGKGPEQLCPFDFRGPCHLDTGKVLVGGDHQVGEGLVVLEVFVVTRLDVFNESVFGQQRVDFAVALHEVDIGDLADPFGGSGFLGGGRLEVASGSRPEVFGFADVDHHP